MPYGVLGISGSGIGTSESAEKEPFKDRGGFLGRASFAAEGMEDLDRDPAAKKRDVPDADAYLGTFISRTRPLFEPGVPENVT